MKKNIYTLVLASGLGTRFDKKKPKQFYLLNNKPLLVYSLESLLKFKFCKHLCLAIHKKEISNCKKIINKYLPQYKNKITIVEGGATRHESCVKGFSAILDMANAKDLVFIHDAARPLIHKNELDALYNVFKNSKVQVASLGLALRETIARTRGDNLVLSQPENEGMGKVLPFVRRGSIPTATIKKAPKKVHQKKSLLKEVYELPDRENLYIVKTPQALRITSLIEMLIDKKIDMSFTDLLTWAEAHHINGVMVPAHPYNIKITTKEDLEFIKKLL